MKWTIFGVIFAVLLMAGTPIAHAQVGNDDLTRQLKETDRPAPVDWGYGPGVKPSQAAKPPVGTTPAAPGTSALKPTATSPATQGANGR